MFSGIPWAQPSTRAGPLLKWAVVARIKLADAAVAVELIADRALSGPQDRAAGAPRLTRFSLRRGDDHIRLTGRGAPLPSRPPARARRQGTPRERARRRRRRRASGGDRRPAARPTGLSGNVSDAGHDMTLERWGRPPGHRTSAARAERPAAHRGSRQGRRPGRRPKMIWCGIEQRLADAASTYQKGAQMSSNSDPKGAPLERPRYSRAPVQTVTATGTAAAGTNTTCSTKNQQRPRPAAGKAYNSVTPRTSYSKARRVCRTLTPKQA